MSRAHVATFYSYKGGVGRSLLLANVGAWLSTQGRRVLLWDLDLEAPGLHEIPRLQNSARPARGFLEWVGTWSTQGRLPLTEARLAQLSASVYSPPSLPHLFLLPAYGQGADFGRLYYEVDWDAFLVRDPAAGLSMFRAALDHLVQTLKLDHVLIDSRTGLTDLGGLLTAILPHTTVLVGGYAHQSLAGLALVRKALEVAGRNPDRGDSPLELVMVASPVPANDEDRRTQREKVWTTHFSARALEIPWEGRLLFEEDLLALDEPQHATALAYLQVAQRLSTQRQALLDQDEAIARVDARFPEVLDPREARRRTGKPFEERVGRVLRLLGYEVQAEQILDGNRVDLVARAQRGFTQECFWVECKDHQGAQGKEVLEKLSVWLNGDTARQMRAQGMVVARSFSPAAITFAKSQEGLLALTLGELEARLFDPAPYLARIRSRYESSSLARTYVEQRILLEALPDRPEGVALMPHALSWARGEGRRLWVVLGDYGTGKSAFFQTLAYRLAVQAEEDPDAPFPLAIDLKTVPNATSLETLLQEHLRETLNWHGDPNILLHLLSAGRVVLLLDAFDEMGVATIGVQVEDQLRRLVEAAGTPPASAPGNRVLVTCRTHFFRDQQQAKDTADGRVSDVEAAEDSALGRLARRFEASLDELALFDEAQVQRFLELHLGPAQAVEAREFINRTYDLGSLAPRPVLLEMIVHTLPRLMVEGGETVRPTDLYRLYTDQWLGDQSGQLRTNPKQRGRILRLLARELWGLEDRRIHYKALSAVLEGLPGELLGRLDPVRIDLELRTAAFLVRSADGFYRFSHKSFLEFFYARHLADLVGEGRVESALGSAPPSPEVLQFLWDLLKAEGLAALADQLRTLLGTSAQGIVSANALRVAVAFERAGRGVAVPEAAQLDGLVLRGEDLAGIRLAGASLCEADLEGAVLREAVLDGASVVAANLRGADLRGASLVGVRAERVVLDKVDGRGCDLREAHLGNASLVAARLVEADLTGAQLDRADLQGARLARAKLPDLAGVRGLEAMGGPGLSPPDAAYGWQIRKTITRLNGATFSPDGTMVATWESGRCIQLWCSKTGQVLHGFYGGAGDVLHLFNLPGEVLHAAFSHSGDTLLTAVADGTACLWDTRTGVVRHILRGHSGPVNLVAISPDDVQLLTASRDGFARLWEANTGRLRHSLHGSPVPVMHAAFAASGDTLLVVSEDGSACLWDARSGIQLHKLNGHSTTAVYAAFSTDGGSILTSTSDGTVCLWDARSGTLRLTLQGHEGSVRMAAFSPNGETLLTASDDSTARLWETQTGKQLHSLIGHTDSVKYASFAPDVAALLTASDDGTVRLWDARSGDLRHSMLGTIPGVKHASFSPDGTSVLAGFCAGFHEGLNNGASYIFDTQTGRPRHILQGRASVVNSLALSPGSELLCVASSEGGVQLWEIRTGRRQRIMHGHSGYIRNATFSSDGRSLVTASDDGTAHHWNVATGELRRTISSPTGPRGFALVLPGGKTVLFGRFDGTQTLWDADDGTVRLSINAGPSASVRSSPDGSLLLIVASTGVANLWDTRTDEIRHTLRGVPNSAPAVFSGDNSTLLADRTVWDTSTGEVRHILQGHANPVTGVAIDGDGSSLVAGYLDGTVQIWDADTGRIRFTLQGHRQQVVGGEFSSNCEVLCTVSEDCTVCIWNSRTGELRHRLDGAHGPITHFGFAPDGATWITTFSDGTTRLWDTQTGALLRVLWATPSGGWASVTADGRWLGEGDGPDELYYTEPGRIGRVWIASDYPELRADRT